MKYELTSIMPDLRGKLRENADLAKTNWFRVGGPAELLFKPENAEDLAYFMRQKPADLPVTVLGVGSNVIVRDGGIDGVVIKLGRGFTELRVQDSGFRFQSEAFRERSDAIHSSDVMREWTAAEAGASSQSDESLFVGAGCLDANVALYAADHGIAGLEFLSGIPGTIGGALRMNAGAYGTEMSDVLIAAELVTGEGETKRVSVDELGYSYRHSTAPNDWVFTKAIFRVEKGEPEEIHQRIREIKQAREATQPVRERTGGSTFKNPEGHKAWQMIDAVGGRGLELEGAQMSEKHCNFMINTGTATARDLEALGEEMRRRVKDHFGVELQWEIQRIGKPDSS